MNGRKKLSRFEGDTNRYPVHLGFAVQAEMRVQDKAAQILLKSHLDAAVNQSGKLGMQIEAPQQRKAECGMALKANAEAALDTGDARITIINNLDQTWKLNGTRKLNGGLYIG